MVDLREQVPKSDRVTPHPTGHGGVLCPTREFYEGRPQAQDELFVKVMETLAFNGIGTPP